MTGKKRGGEARCSKIRFGTATKKGCEFVAPPRSTNSLELAIVCKSLQHIYYDMRILRGRQVLRPDLPAGYLLPLI